MLPFDQIAMLVLNSDCTDDAAEGTLLTAHEDQSGYVSIGA